MTNRHKTLSKLQQDLTKALQEASALEDPVLSYALEAALQEIAVLQKQIITQR